jgi:hypothetical protein
MDGEDVTMAREAERRRSSRFGSWAVMDHVLCRRNTLFSGSDVHWPSDGPVLLNRERSCETRRQRWQNQTFLALKGQGEMMADMVDKL